MDDVLEAVSRAKARGKTCALLIGAGCSVTAGIPAAQGFVERIKSDWSTAYQRAARKASPDNPGYALCMAELSDAERRDLILEAVDTAKLNWAHMAIAQLLSTGFVDRILTTNFDSLILRACALLNTFPAVYDFATSQAFKPAYIPQRAVFYLHGQHTGFALLNTDVQVRNLATSIAPLFEDAGKARIWIIVGYSGENDPVFEQLVAVPQFDERLYWIGFREHDPSPHVALTLLTKSNAYFVRGYDADDFFVLLAQHLGVFPPEFVGRPFSHLKMVLSHLTEYVVPHQTMSRNVMTKSFEFIQHAIGELEDGPEGIALRAEHLLMSGRYAAVVAMTSPNMTPELRDLVAWAHLGTAEAIVDEARATRGDKRATLLDRADMSFAEALRVRPLMQAALNNWALALQLRAHDEDKDAVDRLFERALAMYNLAHEVRPETPEVLINWAGALASLARRKTSAEAESLLSVSLHHASKAHKLKPNSVEALGALGSSYRALGRLQSGDAAKPFFRNAISKYETAWRINPDDLRILMSWGTVLVELAGVSDVAEAEGLYVEACEKCSRASEVDPNNADLLTKWGGALGANARIKGGADARVLYDAAVTKFEDAIRVSPDHISALHDLAITLVDQGCAGEREHVDERFERAYEMCRRATDLVNGECALWKSWGFAYFEHARLTDGPKRVQLLREAASCYEKAHECVPDDCEVLESLALALAEQAGNLCNDEARALFGSALEKCAAAEHLAKSGRVLFNWAAVLARRGLAESSESSNALLTAAVAKYREVLYIEPRWAEALNQCVAVLRELARRHPDRSESFKSEAQKVCLEAEASERGRGSYNLACMAALEGEVEECEEWLAIGRDSDRLPAREVMLSDPDLDKVKGEEWFVRLVGEC